MLRNTPTMGSEGETRILYMLCCASNELRQQMQPMWRKRYRKKNFSRAGTDVMNFLLGYTDEVSSEGRQLYESLIGTIRHERSRAI
jgi:hypothetical protein